MRRAAQVIAEGHGSTATRTDRFVRTAPPDNAGIRIDVARAGLDTDWLGFAPQRGILLPREEKHRELLLMTHGIEWRRNVVSDDEHLT